MTPEQQKEEISKAYVHAVAACCGFKVARWSQDDGCLDCTIGSEGILGHGTIAGPKLDLQLKCTADQRKDRQDYISWRLERRHYDRLRLPAQYPRLLVVLLLPEADSERIEHTLDCLTMRKCAFWRTMTGMPAITTQSKTVRLPKAQVFSPEQLNTIMEKLSREEDV